MAWRAEGVGARIVNGQIEARVRIWRDQIVLEDNRVFTGTTVQQVRAEALNYLRTLKRAEDDARLSEALVGKDLAVVN